MNEGITYNFDNILPNNAPIANPINTFITYFAISSLLNFFKMIIKMETTNPIILTAKEAKNPYPHLSEVVGIQNTVYIKP